MNPKRFPMFAGRYFQSLCLLVVLSLLLGLMGPVKIASAATTVTLDGAVSSDAWTSTTDDKVSLSHTTGTGTNRLMLVGVSWNSYNQTRDIDSVTFSYGAGPTVLSLTEVGVATYSADYRYTAIWSLLAPPSGETGTVEVTFSGSLSYGLVVGVVNFAGVDQGSPLGTFEDASGSSTTATVDVTGLDGDELVFDTVFAGASSAPILTVGADQAQQWNDGAQNSSGGGSTEDADGNSSVTMSWGRDSSGIWVIGAVPINPAPVGPTQDLTIAVSPSGGGTTDPSEGVHTYPQNDDVDVTATANEGYEFSNWSGDCTGTDPDVCQVTMDQDRAVTANFAALPEYTLAVGTTGDGSVTLDPAGGTYYEGTTVTLTPVPGPCYTFDGWSGTNAGDIQGAGPYTILMDGNKSVTADFGALPQYTLTAGDDGNGSVTLDPAGGTYCTGTTVTLTPVPNSGYTFDHWSGTDSSDILDTGGVYTIVMDDPKSVTANFAVALWPTLDGAVSSGTADGADSISVSHTTGTGINRLMLVGVSVNNYSTEPTIDSVTFSYDSTDLPLTLVGAVNYEGRYVAIYGLADPPNGQPGTAEVEFSEAVGYGIVAGVANFAGVDQATPWGTFVSAYAQSDTPSVDVTGLTGDELVFDTVFIGAATIPTLTPGADQTELWNATDNRAGGVASTEQATGSSVTMSWTAGSTVYWAIGAVPINPAPVGPTQDLTIAVSPSGGGTTDPGEGVHTYPQNDDVDITATPNVGYEFSNWSGDCTGTDPDVCQVTMDADKTVTANFAPQNYDLTMAVSPSGGGTTTPAVGGPYSYGAGAVVDITATANTGYRFVDWTGDVADPNSASTTVTMDGNKTVTANFAVYTPPTVDGAASSATADDVASIDIPHTTGTGTNRLMLVGVSWNSGSNERDITSVTFSYGPGPTVLSLSEVIDEQTSSQPRNSAIYSLLNPPSNEAGTVTVNFSGDVSNGIVAGVANFAGVDQTTPLGTPDGASSTSGSAPTVTLNGLSGDELVFDNVFQGASGETQTLTAGSGQTQLWNAWIANTRAAASAKEAASAISVTMSWTAASASYWAIAAVPINPAAGGVTCYALTLGHTGDGADPVASPANSTGCTAGTYVAGENISLSGAAADLGSGIASWYGTGDDSSTANTNSVTMPASAHSTGVNYLRLLGDVNLDGNVDSTDALIILTADAGLPTATGCPMNYGDVDGDGYANSTDALIVLTYDVGLPVGGLPVREPVAEPVLVTQPPGCLLPAGGFSEWSWGLNP